MPRKEPVFDKPLVSRFDKKAVDSRDRVAMPAGVDEYRARPEDYLVTAIVDTESPTSLYNMFESPHFREAVSKLTAEDLEMTEDEIKKKLPSRINAEFRRLRMRLWEEYTAAVSRGRNFTPHVIIREGVSASAFLRAMNDKLLLCFLLKQPVAYKLQSEEALSVGLDAVRELLELPVVDSVTGKINTSLAALQLRTVQWLDARVKGSIVQRIEQKSVNVNVGTDSRIVPNDVAGSAISVDDIDRKLLELEKKAAIVSPQIEAAGLVGIEAHSKVIDVE